MAVRGQRFHFDLDSDDDSDEVHSLPTAKVPGFNLGLVKDIKERTAVSDVKPPVIFESKASETGFPAHKTRIGPSRFKQRREEQVNDISQTRSHAGSYIASPPLSHNVSPKREQRKDFPDIVKDPSIDQENKQRLAQMSDEEIEEARTEVTRGLSSSLIERLLQRANIDEGRNDLEGEMGTHHNEANLSSKAAFQQATYQEPEVEQISFPATRPARPNPQLSSDPDAPPLYPPPDLQPASQIPTPASRGMHFPQPPKPPDLDPSDPDFLSALHTKYFPSLPSDPSTMAWMTHIDPETEKESAYSSTQSSLAPSSLRFDFRGHLLPPRLSAQISQTKGLHHHAHAPSSAGYTIPELAHLARSAYPAQRCIAYQTLGRVLYRLGRGDFGRQGEDLCEGLWTLMDQGRVVEGMVAAAAKGEEGGNRSIWVTATEAIWLWRKGGGRKWKGR